MAQMSSILAKIAAKRTAWEQIPQSVIDEFENELSLLSKMGYEGDAFKVRANKIYNTMFNQYGYNKP